MILSLHFLALPLHHQQSATMPALLVVMVSPLDLSGRGRNLLVPIEVSVDCSVSEARLVESTIRPYQGADRSILREKSFLFTGGFFFSSI